MPPTQEKRRASDGLHFSREIRLGEVITVLAFVGSVVGIYVTLREDIVLLKQGQNYQADTTRSIRSEIREVRDDVRDLRSAVVGNRGRGG